MFSKDLPRYVGFCRWVRRLAVRFATIPPHSPLSDCHRATDAPVSRIALVSPDSRPDVYPVAAQGIGHGGIHDRLFLGLFRRSAQPAEPGDGDAADLARYRDTGHLAGFSVLCLALGLCLATGRLHEGYPSHVGVWGVDGADVPALPGHLLVIAHRRAASRHRLAAVSGNGSHQGCRYRRQRLPVAACRLGGIRCGLAGADIRLRRCPAIRALAELAALPGHPVVDRRHAPACRP